MIQDMDGLWYAMRLEGPWRQDSGIDVATKQLVVIVAHELKRSGLPVQSQHTQSDIFSFQDHAVGILASINKFEAGIIYATAHEHVALELLGEGTQRYLSIAMKCACGVDVPHSVLLNESHADSKERYRATAQAILEDKDTLDLLTAQARHLGEDDTYEHLLDDMLDQAVVMARFGDCCMVEKLPECQE